MITTPPDWEAIARALFERVDFAINHAKFGGGLMMDLNTLQAQHPKDYLADALDLMPGVKVNRERLHMTQAQRRKHSATAAKEPTK